ncbi:hypothetical protein [Chryseolinea lacunae]|uniref:DUF2541 domain-containing protein n=1 Tax=Chryseolinea lacunae TaxID=2801331 RepID=A0ABS1KX23_9BACT|nr:hypothetical protein [Chryseolinea lacunae]MBL0743929.1 hypothetical protein [Chryseolinea lacunae]
MKKLTLVAVMLCMAFAAALAQEPAVMFSNKPGWHKIGEVKADFKMENESISVLGADKFKSILLKVTDAPINIADIEVIYESGDKEKINVKNELKANAETRVIDLKTPNQEIKKVVFTYKTLPNSKADKAHVELYGLK